MKYKLIRLIDLIPVVCVACLAAPAVFLLLGGINIPGEGFFLPAAACCSVVLGYALQNLSARITGLKVDHFEFVGRNRRKFDNFRAAYAPIPLLLIAVLAFLLYYGLQMLFLYLSETGAIEQLNDGTVYPFVGAVLFFLCGFFGVTIWFFSIEQLSNVSYIYISSAVFLLEFLYSMFSPDPGEVIACLSVCVFVFGVCLMMIYNQTNLQRTHLGTVVAAASPAARLYNLFLVLALLICLVFTLGVTYVIVRGLYIIGSFLVFLVLYKIFYQQEVEKYQQMYNYPSPEETAADFTKILQENGGNTIVPIFLMLVTVIVLLIIGAKTGVLQKLVAYLKEVIREFFYTMKLGKELWDERDLFEIPGNFNYKDQKKKLQDASIREYMGMAEGTDSYALFLRRLAKLPDADAQLSFAYAMLVTAYRKKSGNLRLSDTPREIEGKVKHLVPEEEIAYITRQFENVKYGEKPMSQEEAAAVLDRICAQVKRYIF